MLMELFERLRQWLRPRPEENVPTDEGEDRSMLADLARLLKESEPPR
jgi:hypothetical protein